MAPGCCEQADLEALLRELSVVQAVPGGLGMESVELRVVKWDEYR